MNIAFYAPMKPPDHPTHSGDRLIAGLFLEALKRGGHRPVLASRFRSYEGSGDAVQQRRLRSVGERLAERLARRFNRLEPRRRPDCWFTYHLYHRAPDWLGPRVCRELGIPYVVAEASVAPKQARGPWRDGFAAATDAIAGADLVVALNSSDIPCLEPVVADSAQLVYLKPFLDLSLFGSSGSESNARAQLAAELGISSEKPWLVTVAMMRRGNKLDSYEVLARALAILVDNPWHLLILGDGPERGRVESAFERIPSNRISFLGLRYREAVAAILCCCDLFVWPAVAEPLGMAMLEAHAAGLAVVAGNSGGVADFVQDGVTGRLTPLGEVGAFAAAVQSLLVDAGKRRAFGRKAREQAMAHHGLDAAARALTGWLDDLTRGGTHA